MTTNALSSFSSRSLDPLKEWLHEFVLRPFLEGAARLNRAWEGVNFHLIYRPAIYLKDRVICILTGLFLISPFFNFLVWKGLETFFRPEILSEPYRSYEEPTVPVETNQPIEIIFDPPEKTVPILPLSQSKIAPKLRYSETTGNQTIFSDWNWENQEGRFKVTKSSPDDSVKSEYDENWTLQKYDYKGSLGRFEARLEGRKIFASGQKGELKGSKEHDLKKDYPWIQQMTLGFKNFASSPDQTLPFYAIYPKDLSLVEAVATKVGLEKDPELGELLKIKLNIAGWFYSLLGEWQLWIHPETGHVWKMNTNSGRMTQVTVTKLVQSNL